MEKCLLLLLLISVCSFKSFPQKLPKSQAVGIKLSSNFRIDGKANEGIGYSAYNNSTDIFYSLANNETNLYLIIKAERPEVIRKIILGAITLTINKTHGTTETNSKVSITYPIYDRKDGPVYINLKNITTANKKSSSVGVDSFMNAVNKQLMAKTKLIGIAGIKEIKDSILSIYNEDGIKAISRFNDKIEYIYELLIPLRYLGLSINDHWSFSYNIKLNGTATNGTRTELLPSGRFIQVSEGTGKGYLLPATPENIILSTPTDFSAKYNLIR
jgi:hypothetical protein